MLLRGVLSRRNGEVWGMLRLRGEWLRDLNGVAPWRSRNLWVGVGVGVGVGAGVGIEVADVYRVG